MRTTITHRRVLHKVQTRGFKQCTNENYILLGIPTYENEVSSTANVMCLFL